MRGSKLELRGTTQAERKVWPQAVHPSFVHPFSPPRLYISILTCTSASLRQSRLRPLVRLAWKTIDSERFKPPTRNTILVHPDSVRGSCALRGSIGPRWFSTAHSAFCPSAAPASPSLNRIQIGKPWGHTVTLSVGLLRRRISSLSVPSSLLAPTSTEPCPTHERFSVLQSGFLRHSALPNTAENVDLQRGHCG